MAGSCLKFLKELWNIFNAPNNSPVIVGLCTTMFGLIVSYFLVWRQFKARLQEKDKRIEELVAERNDMQDLLFKKLGINRESTQSGKRKK